MKNMTLTIMYLDTTSVLLIEIIHNNEYLCDASLDHVVYNI